MSLKYQDVRHGCRLPNMDKHPSYGGRGQVLARWRCPECKTRWRYEAEFLDHNLFYWTRASAPSWRWRRAERRRWAASDAT